MCNHDPSCSSSGDGDAYSSVEHLPGTRLRHAAASATAKAVKVPNLAAALKAAAPLLVAPCDLQVGREGGGNSNRCCNNRAAVRKKERMDERKEPWGTLNGGSPL